MFMPVIEYQLTIDRYKELNKQFYVDSRMKKSVQRAAEFFGGIVKKHPKGHSKVKATMDVLFEQLAAEENTTVAGFLKAHPGFRMLQPEYSLHMFSSNEKGVSIDDAIRFAFIWLEMFSKVKQKHNQPKWTLQDYLDDLEAKGIIDEVFQIEEQRTSMPEVAKKMVMIRMAEKVKQFFSERTDFSSSEEWRTFESDAPYVLVDIEGVFDLSTPIGDAFWGWSNTSEKVAIGMQSASEESLKELSDIIVSLFVQSRQEIAQELNLVLPEINAKETGALLEKYNVDNTADVEAAALEAKPAIFVDFVSADSAMFTKAEFDWYSQEIQSASTDDQIRAILDPFNNRNNTGYLKALRLLGAKRKNKIKEEAAEFVELFAQEEANEMPFGGIDLNSALLDLQIKRDGEGVPLPVNLQDFESMNIQGFMPIIINVTPIPNLPMILGFFEEETYDDEYAGADVVISEYCTAALRKFWMREIV